MSDQAAISFVPLDPPTDGIIALFAEEGPKFTPIAKTIDKESKGLLSRAAEISGFKGKKDSAVDLIAPSGLKFARLVLIGMDKPSSYSEEDWLNLGGSVRAQFAGREGDTVHIVLDVGRALSQRRMLRTLRSARSSAATNSKNTNRSRRRKTARVTSGP